MGRLLALGAIASILLLSRGAVACQADSDCPAASHCVPTFGRMEGVCERGVAPINGEVRRHLGEPGAPKGTEGQVCELAEDCAPGLSCVEQSNSLVRVCIR